MRWGQLPCELARHVLAWTDTCENLGCVSRQWRAVVGQALFTERARRLRWQQLRGSLVQLPCDCALDEVLRWGPPHLQDAVDQFAGALETWFTRWVLFTYWSADLWGGCRPRSVQAALDRLSVRDTRLAMSAHMSMGENAVTWWMFTQHWSGSSPNGLTGLQSACAAVMTPEQAAFAWCAERSLLTT